MYIWSLKLYIWYHGNYYVGMAISLPLIPIKLIFENILSKAEQKTTVARYQTCYMNSTEGTVHWSIWKNLQPPIVFLDDAKNHRYWIMMRHYACYGSNTNNKLTYFQKVLMVSNPSSHVRLFVWCSSWHKQFSRARSGVQSTKVTCSLSAHLLKGILRSQFCVLRSVYSP